METIDIELAFKNLVMAVHNRSPIEALGLWEDHSEEIIEKTIVAVNRAMEDIYNEIEEE